MHSAGSLALQGGSAPLLALEERLADLLAHLPRGGGFRQRLGGRLRGRGRAGARIGYYIVIDAAAQASLQDGAANRHGISTAFPVAQLTWSPNVWRASANVTLTMDPGDHRVPFLYGFTVPDLRALQNACRDHQATLLVDVAHDLGAIGDGGLGFVGEQGMAGEIDIIMGSFAPTFASNGGFVASNAIGLKQALQVFAAPQLFSSALSPGPLVRGLHRVLAQAARRKACILLVC